MMDFQPEIVYKAPKFALNALVLGVVAYLALRSDTLATHNITQSVVPATQLAKWNDLRNNTLGGPAKMDAFMKSIARAHVFEGLLMALVCYWKGASKRVGVRWILTTTALGIPAWIAFFSLNSHKRALKRVIISDYANDKKRK